MLDNLVDSSDNSSDPQLLAIFNNDKEIKVLARKGRKIAMTTTSIKPADKKLLTMSAKGALNKDVQDVSMKKVWI